MNDPLCLENLFGNLGRVLPVFNEKKNQEQIGRRLYPNANLKVSVSAISDLWKRFRISHTQEFIGKEARPSKDSVLEFSSFKASCSEADIIF